MSRAPRAIVFDFDGVIVESVEIKTEAFRELFAEHGALLDEFIAYHLANEGLSRYRKFEYFYAELLGEPLREEESEELSRRFSEICVERIKACPLVAGALEFLERHHAAIPLFVASGTPEGELRDIVRARGLERYFAGVFGAPATKSEIVARILADTGIAAGDLLFVGDSLTDLSEAAKAGVRFVGRLRGTGGTEVLAGTGALLVRDLFELDGYLRDPTRSGAAAQGSDAVAALGSEEST